MRRRGRIELFNFSFLDILATVLGVLLFILLFAILSQSDLHQQSDAYQRHEVLLAGLQTVREAEEAEKRAQEIQGEILGLKPKADEAPRENVALVEELGGLQGKIKDLEGKIKDTRAQIEKKNRAAVLPTARGGGKGVPYHIDCLEDRLVLLGSNLDEGLGARPVCRLNEIGKAGSPFSQLIQKIKQGQLPGDTVLVFWVRPSGIKVSNAAKVAARKAKVRLGWEPADEDWQF